MSLQVGFGSEGIRAGDFYAIAAGGLGRVEGAVGLAQQFFDRLHPHSWLINRPRLMVRGTRPLVVGTSLWEMDLRISSARARAKAGLQLFNTTRNSSPP